MSIEPSLSIILVGTGACLPAEIVAFFLSMPEMFKSRERKSSILNADFQSRIFVSHPEVSLVYVTSSRNLGTFVAQSI